jgi:hypothetical protein
MSTRNVERELTTLLHRHAEDAMNDTDTQAEQNRFYDVIDAEPSTDRRSLAVVGAVAAAGVAAAVVWSLGGSESGTGLPPADDPSTQASGQMIREAELTADRFMAAFADGDAAAASSLIRVGAWDGGGLEQELAFLEAWYIRYDAEPCRTTASVYDTLMVECQATVHSARSEELGRGPFGGVVFSFVVRGGEIVDGSNNHNHQYTGLGDHMDEVGTWIDSNAAPADRALLLKDLSELSANEVDRWVQLNRQYIDAYVEEKTSEGNG